MRSARALARILAVAATGVLLASTPGTPDELRKGLADLRGIRSAGGWESLPAGKHTGTPVLAAISTGRTRVIPLRRPVAVVVQYWTASAEADRALHFHPDRYGRDSALLAQLDQP